MGSVFSGSVKVFSETFLPSSYAYSNLFKSLSFHILSSKTKR